MSRLAKWLRDRKQPVTASSRSYYPTKLRDTTQASNDPHSLMQDPASIAGLSSSFQGTWIPLEDEQRRSSGAVERASVPISEL